MGRDRLALDVLEHEVGQAPLGGAAVQQPRDVGVAEPGHDAPFREKAGTEIGAGPRRQQLERHPAVERAVGALGEPDRPHSATRQQPEWPVARRCARAGSRPRCRAPRSARPARRRRWAPRRPRGGGSPRSHNWARRGPAPRGGGARTTLQGQPVLQCRVHPLPTVGRVAASGRERDMARRRRLGPQLPVEPCARGAPVALHGVQRDAQCLGGLGNAQPREEPELDDAELTIAHLAQPLERLVERQQLVGASDGPRRRRAGRRPREPRRRRTRLASVGSPRAPGR